MAPNFSRHELPVDVWVSTILSISNCKILGRLVLRVCDVGTLLVEANGFLYAATDLLESKDSGAEERSLA